MKALKYIAVLALSALTLYGCSPSTIEVETSQEIPEGAIMESSTLPKMTLPETTKYTIPADAETGEQGGPGAMATTQADYSYYPEDKRPHEGDSEGTLVIVYKVVDGGIDQDFESVEVCDAQSLIDAMVRVGAIKEGTKVESFEVDGKSAVLKLDQVSAVAYKAKEEAVAAGIANTFIDNLDLEEVQLVIGDKDYGKLSFSSEYDVT